MLLVKGAGITSSIPPHQLLQPHLYTLEDWQHVAIFALEVKSHYEYGRFNPTEGDVVRIKVSAT